jgi:DNA-binding transcriptional regulator YhcF (GntR family)
MTPDRTLRAAPAARHFPGGRPGEDNRGVTLHIEIDPAGGDAPYEQLRSQIADRARDGSLPVGYKLPTVRGLAADLGIAANTVAKAYRVLETDGVIETRGRNGTFVAAAGDAAAQEAAEAAAAFARRARRLGLTEDEARQASDEALRAVYEA